MTNPWPSKPSAVIRHPPSILGASRSRAAWGRPPQRLSRPGNTPSRANVSPPAHVLSGDRPRPLHERKATMRRCLPVLALLLAWVGATHAHGLLIPEEKSLPP